MKANHKKIAEQFFRGVYHGDLDVVDKLASEDIISSYPIYEKLFNTPVIRGHEAIKEFASGFSKRWIDQNIVIHETIAEGNRVVFLWSFQARNAGTGLQGTPPTNQVQSWGGLTLFRFNESGKIVAKIGEESSPGPFVRSMS